MHSKRATAARPSFAKSFLAAVSLNFTLEPSLKPTVSAGMSGNVERPTEAREAYLAGPHEDECPKSYPTALSGLLRREFA